MSQVSPQAPIKPIMVLNVIATLFSVGVLIALIALGYTGFGTSYSASTTCNFYLARKYETEMYIGYRLRFIMTIIAVLFLSVDTIHSIQGFLQFQKIQQRRNAQIFQWSDKELCLKYICQSIAILCIISVFVFYISIMVQQGKCFRSIYVNWMIIMLLSLFSLLLTIISWILLFKYALERPLEMKHEKQKKKIGMGVIRQKQAEMQNIFETQGSELYNTIKRQNKDSTQPLLVHNAPIPLFPNQMARAPRKEPILQKSRQGVLQMSQYIQKINNQANQQLPSPSNRRKNGVPTSFNQRKKSSSSQKAQDPQEKTKFSAMIQTKKKRFRELNPLKQSAGIKDQEQIKEQIIISQNKMNNLPRSYIEYIKQAKKPKRNPPNIDLILQNFNKEQSLKAQALALQEQKPFLKKYRKDQQQKKLQKKQNNQQIQFIDEQFRQKQEKQQVELQQTILQQNEAQLFFHKPRSDKTIRKRRKALFDEDVSDANKLIEQNLKQVIINKIKQAKIASRQIQKNENFLETLKSPKKRNVIKSKEEIMLSFLKSKYSTPQQSYVDRDDE